MQVLTHPVLSWEPLRLILTFNPDSGVPDLTQFRQWLERWLEARPSSPGCQCGVKYVDVLSEGRSKIKILVQWLCSVCLPSLLNSLGSEFPSIEKIEIGLKQDPGRRNNTFVPIEEKSVLLETGARSLVRSFSISRFEVSVRQFSEFCRATAYKTTAELQSDTANFQSNFSLEAYSRAAKLNQAATHISFNDALAFCKWSGYRLPTEEEFLAASLIDNEIHEISDESSHQQEIRRRLTAGTQPSFAGYNITSTIMEDGRVVHRSGPKYALEKGWEQMSVTYRKLRAPDYYDAITNFHVCDERQGR